MKNKKMNPRRVPLSLASVKQEISRAVSQAIDSVTVIFLTVMLDKHNTKKEELQTIGKEVNDLSESVSKGYVSLADLKRVLRDEYDIYIDDGVRIGGGK